MRRAQDRSSGIQGGSQQGQTGQRVGATGSGATSGGAATGGRETVTRETVRETPATTTTTTATQERQPASASYPRSAPSAGYGRQPSGGGGLGSTSNLHGGLFSTLAGLMTFLAGLSLVARHHFYHSLPGYAYNWTIPSWGWVLVGLGIVLFASGASHLLHIPFSRILCVVLATLAVVAGFMIIPFVGLAVWGIIIAALAAIALWGLLHGAERQAREHQEQEMMGRQQYSGYGGQDYGGQEYGGSQYGARQQYGRR